MQDRDVDILFFMNNYLKNPNDRSYHQLITMIEADFLKISVEQLRKQKTKEIADGQTTEETNK
jgi:hypothetical protein